jgi:ribA/ribD-fused uncharacterized protein
MKMIDQFRGEYNFLSNFSPHSVCLAGDSFIVGLKSKAPYIDYPTAEHAFQAHKTTDIAWRQTCAKLKTPDDAKRFGRRGIILREDWEEIKLEVMYAVVLAKFEQHGGIRKLLLDTGDIELIEGNTWGDNYWGCIKRNSQWIGANHLGHILMQVREELRNGIN